MVNIGVEVEVEVEVGVEVGVEGESVFDIDTLK